MNLPSCFPAGLRAVLLIAGMQCGASTAWAGQYAESFDGFAVDAADLLPAGELFSSPPGSTAKVVDTAARELQLTADTTEGMYAAFRLPDLDPGTATGAFSVKWNALIHGDTGGETGGGFSLSFGPLAGIPAVDFTNGTYRNEEGFRSGLTVSVCTGGGNAPGCYVRVNGAMVPGGFVATPGAAWDPSSATRHFFEVDWHYFHGLTLRVDGTPVFTGLAVPGFAPGAGHRFVFAARAEGAGQGMRLDDIVIFTGGVLRPLPVEAPYYSSGAVSTDSGPERAFDGDTATAWLASGGTSTLGAGVPAGKTVRAYTLTSAPEIPGRDPKSWAFETSGDGITWTGRGTETARYFQNRGGRCAFMVTSPAAGTKFRLNITANNGALETGLAGFQPWELVPGPECLQVSTAADGGPGSLAETLTAAAAARAGGAVITFAPALSGATLRPAAELVIPAAAIVALESSDLPGGLILHGGKTHRLLTNAGGRLKISGLTFTGGNGDGSTLARHGGAFLGDGGSVTDFLRCTFKENTGGTGGAVLNLGAMTLTDCAVSGNYAGDHGGGIHNEGDLLLTRCTLAGNVASAFGGGVENTGGPLALVHCTIAGNTSGTGGSGVGNYEGRVTMAHSIVAGNTLTNGQPDDVRNEGASALITRAGVNIVRAFTTLDGAADTGPAAVTADPLLAPLGSCGGPTQTMPLRPGSPAREASADSTATADQRGVPVSGVPDTGAYETGSLTGANYTAWIWESLPASTSAARHAADADEDGDGIPNGDEWLALTDPASALSRFTPPVLSRDAGGLTLSWTGSAGRTYTPEHSPDLLHWSSLAPMPGVDGLMSLTLSAPAETGLLLRVRVGR